MSCDLNHELSVNWTTAPANPTLRKMKKKHIEFFFYKRQKMKTGKTITIIPWIQQQTCSKLIKTKQKDTFLHEIKLQIDWYTHTNTRIHNNSKKKSWKFTSFKLNNYFQWVSSAVNAKYYGKMFFMRMNEMRVLLHFILLLQNEQFES